MGIFTIIDATGARGAPLWREMYAFIFISIVLVILVKLYNNKFDKKLFITSTIFIFISFIIGLMVVFQDVVYPIYIIGDYIVILFPIILLLLYALDKKLYDRKNIDILISLLLIAALIAPLTANKLYSGRYDWIDRFDPPHILLFVTIWVHVFISKNKLKYIAIILNIMLFLLAFYSGQRTALLLWLLSGFFVWIYYFQLLSTIKKFIIVSSIFLVLPIMLIPISNNINNLDIGRFDKITNNGVYGDESIMGRVYEVLDILRITELENSPLLIIFGHGYGATFKADIAYKDGHPNLTPEDRIHNIHIGPALLFYRYGLIAFIAYIILSISLSIFLLKIKKHRKNLSLSKYEIIFIITLLVELVNFLMRNVLIDPIYSYILVAVIGIYIKKYKPYYKKQRLIS